MSVDIVDGNLYHGGIPVGKVVSKQGEAIFFLHKNKLFGSVRIRPRTGEFKSWVVGWGVTYHADYPDAMERVLYALGNYLERGFGL